MTRAVLYLGTNESWLSVWQSPDSSGEVLRLLMQGTVDLHRLHQAPHQLVLSRGEERIERLAVFYNIMLR